MWGRLGTTELSICKNGAKCFWHRFLLGMIQRMLISLYLHRLDLCAIKSGNIILSPPGCIYMSNKRQVRHVVTLSELQIKEVIVMNDGKRLGHSSDLEIDGDNGRITALVIMAKEKKSGFFGKSDELIIPWNYIEVIGTDVILVKEVKTPSLYTEQKLLE